MIQIRQQQFAALLQPAVEEWLAGHLDRYFPMLRISYPGDRFDRFVRHAVTRAAFHEFTSGPHIAHWANLMAVFGERFDQAPEHGWAQQILNQHEHDSPDSKIKLLLDAAERHMPGKL